MRAKASRKTGPPLAQRSSSRPVHAGHTGKLSYARVWSGAIKDGVTLGSARLGGGIYPACWLLSFSKVAEAVEGEVVALGRLDGVPDGRHHFARCDTGATGVPAPPPPGSIRWRS